jgi:hypothetical protein
MTRGDGTKCAKKQNMSRPVSAVVLLVVLAALVASCAWPVTMWVPTSTPLLQPASPFRYMPRATVQTGMRRLADDLVTLEDALAGAEVRQQAVLDALADMQDAVTTMAPSGESTNHPKLDAAFQQFAFDIETARNAAAFDPPSYTAAAAVPSMCQRCHRAQ